MNPTARKVLSLARERLHYRIIVLILLCIATSGWTLDWPQFQGPDRTSISQEKGLLKVWPQNGLRTLWRIPLGDGYSGISVSNGKAYTMFTPDESEYVLCVDAESGKELWRTKVGPRYKGGRGDGSRSTPTLGGGIAYTLSAAGMLHALNADTGHVIWKHDMTADFGGKAPPHGYSMSPLIEGGMLLVEAGGTSNRTVVALNKKNGKVVWTAGTDKAGYSSPIAVTVHGTRQILFFTGTSLLSISPKGEVYWRFPWSTKYDINVATPILIPPDKVFISSAYDTGAALLQIKMENQKPMVEKIWESKVMKNHFHSSILYGNHLYGFDNAVLVCMDALTGEQKWQHSGFGKGSLIMADGHFIILGERGQLALVEVSPVEFKEKFQYQVFDGVTWTAPTLANGKLYLRNQKEMLCLDIAKPTQSK